MELIEVGKKYPSVYDHYDGIKMNITESGINFILTYDSPTEDEICNIKSGSVKVGVIEKNNILITLLKFGELEWMDATYSIELSNMDGNVLTDISDFQGYSTLIVLIDTKTGIVKALRNIGLPTNSSKAIQDTIDNQFKNRSDKKTVNKQISSIYNNYSTLDLLKLCTSIESI